MPQMLSSELLSIVVGVSSFLGFLSLVAYLYSAWLFRKAERSIRGYVEGDALFNASQVIKILQQFKDEPTRLEALRLLTHYSLENAKALLRKVEGNIDVAKFQATSTKDYQQLSVGAAVFFVALAGVGLVYESQLASNPDPTATPPPLECRQFGRPSGGPKPGCECGTKSVAIIPWTEPPSSVRSDVQGMTSAHRGSRVGIQFEANPVCTGQSIRASESYIDWGDGTGRETVGDILQGCRDHQYKSEGNFDVRVRVSLECYDTGSANCSKRCEADGAIKANITPSKRK